MRTIAVAIGASLLTAVTMLGLSQAVSSSTAASLPSAIAANVPEIRACANRDSGALRLLTEGRCSKRERLITWSQAGPPGPAGAPGATGPAGAQGAQGPGPIVTDGNGNRVPGVVDIDMAGSHLGEPSRVIWRVVEGRLWPYLPAGDLNDESDKPYFLGKECDGTPLWNAYDGGRSYQQVIFGISGNVYAFNMRAFPIHVDDMSKEAVRMLDSGCSSPKPLSDWVGSEYSIVNFWPLTPISKPPDLVGPLIVSSQD